MNKIFWPSQTRNTLIWGLVILAIIDIPFLFFFISGSKGPPFFTVFMGFLFLLVIGLVLVLTISGKRMSYELGPVNFMVHFGFSRRRIPYTSIRDIQLLDTTLLFRLFGGSWPGLHWGLYTARDVGRVWVYSTKMRGDFVLITLVDGTKIAISPEDPTSFLREVNTQRPSFGQDSPSDVTTFKTSLRLIYIQVFAVGAAFLVFLGYLLWIYPLLPEVIPVHFDLNWNPNRWAHKSELFLIAGIAAIFPIINTILTLKFGRYGRDLMIFLGVIFILIQVLFFGIIYFTYSIV